MAETFADVAVGVNWTDLAATNPDMSGASGFVQNKSGTQVLVQFNDSASAPVDSSGVALSAFDVVNGTAAHVWVKAPNGGATVACGLTD